MKKSLATLSFFFLSTMAMADSITPLVLSPAGNDTRTEVPIPKAFEDEFRNRMANYLVHKQKVVSLLESGGYKEAAAMANIGHGPLQVMSSGKFRAFAYYPKPMKDLNVQLRETTKEFLTVVENNGEKPAIYAAYNKVANVCNECHVHYKAKFTSDPVPQQ